MLHETRTVQWTWERDILRILRKDYDKHIDIPHPPTYSAIIHLKSLRPSARHGSKLTLLTTWATGDDEVHYGGVWSSREHVHITFGYLASYVRVRTLGIEERRATG